MKFAEIQILTHRLAKQRAFYTQTLGLPDATTAPDTFTAQVGATRLTFVQAQPGWGADGGGVYHFAFNIPENQFAAAKAWLQQRTPLVVSRSGQDEYNFESWNAHAVYFFDAAGNVLELIARHNLPNASPPPFGGHCLLNISEISVTARDVLNTVHTIQSDMAVEVYDGPSATFAAVGDEDGLFIVVPVGRAWFPDTGLQAGFYPLTVRLEDGRSWSAPIPVA
jgi:catechol-2,3-dioxygenase